MCLTGRRGKQTLSELFEGRRQLIVYHFMFGPDWPEGCPACSMCADHYEPAIVHLHQRDVTMVTVSRAPARCAASISEADGLGVQVGFVGGE